MLEQVTFMELKGQHSSQCFVCRTACKARVIGNSCNQLPRSKLRGMTEAVSHFNYDGLPCNKHIPSSLSPQQAAEYLFMKGPPVVHRPEPLGH